MTKILVISDDSGLKSKTATIAKPFTEYVFTYIESYAKIYAHLKKVNPDIIIAQLGMPGRINFEGLVQILKENEGEGEDITLDPLATPSYILYSGSDDLSQHNDLENMARRVGLEVISSVSKYDLYGLPRMIMCEKSQ